MLIKTHLVLVLFLMLVFLPHVTYKAVFFVVLLIASLIPDIDNAFSTLGKNRIFRILQWITKHRGVWHSLTFCIVISIVLTFVYPPSAFPFFLGYGMHLFVDSFTVEGIRPFWPLNSSISGKVTTGGKIEYLIFVMFSIFDVILLISWLV